MAKGSAWSDLFETSVTGLDCQVRNLTFQNLPIECVQGHRPARCPNHFFAVNEPSAVPWW